MNKKKDIILLLNGKPEAGKTTIAENIYDEINHYNYVEPSDTMPYLTSFSSSLKALTEYIFNTKIKGKDYFVDLRKKGEDQASVITLRDFYRNLAESSKYIFNQDLFINDVITFIKSIKKNINYRNIVIIDDFRFIEQYEALKQAFPNNIIITCHIKPLSENIKHYHYTENSLNDFTFNIEFQNVDYGWESDPVLFYKKIKQLVSVVLDKDLDIKQITYI